MKIDLTGKTALITGSSKGIGLATANAFQDAGAAVIVHGRSAQDVSDLATGMGARGLAADLGTPDGCARLAAEAGEVAHMILYACSPQASATTGTSLRVDGGVVEML